MYIYACVIASCVELAALRRANAGVGVSTSATATATATAGAGTGSKSKKKKKTSQAQTQAQSDASNIRVLDIPVIASTPATKITTAATLRSVLDGTSSITSTCTCIFIDVGGTVEKKVSAFISACTSSTDVVQIILPCYSLWCTFILASFSSGCLSPVSPFGRHLVKFQLASS